MDFFLLRSIIIYYLVHLYYPLSFWINICLPRSSQISSVQFCSSLKSFNKLKIFGWKSMVFVVQRFGAHIWWQRNQKQFEQTLANYGWFFDHAHSSGGVGFHQIKFNIYSKEDFTIWWRRRRWRTRRGWTFAHIGWLWYQRYSVEGTIHSSTKSEGKLGGKC